MATGNAWRLTCNAITENDPHCRGILVLGLDAPLAELKASFAAAARFELVRGFAVGRTIFGDAARGWMSDELDDEQAVTLMADNYARLCGIWDEARTGKGGEMP